MGVSDLQNLYPIRHRVKLSVDCFTWHKPLQPVVQLLVVVVTGQASGGLLLILFQREEARSPFVILLVVDP